MSNNRNSIFSQIISILFNCVIMISTVVSVLSFFTVGGKGNMGVTGSRCFRYFTIDSNILIALASAVVIAFDIALIIQKKDKLPKAVIAFKYSATVAISVTFFTVMVFLGPVSGYAPMIEGMNFFMHITTPVLAMISFFFFEHGSEISPLKTILGMLPVILYGCVYIYMVLISKKWEDFYHFNMNGKWIISVIAMLIGSYIIALLWRFIHNKTERSKFNK